jgi:hypothetical protein
VCNKLVAVFGRNAALPFVAFDKSQVLKVGLFRGAGEKHIARTFNCLWPDELLLRPIKAIRRFSRNTWTRYLILIAERGSKVAERVGA